jgi:leader peptidase (prepilin peptidase)/N-methyltransferase
MILTLALIMMIAALGLLAALSVIDLRVRLLPNRLVLPFAVTGLFFHIITAFDYMPITTMALGALLGGGILYGIRFVANRLYGQDTLGLGDVKLMAAAGLWLGDWVLLALCAGAVFGMMHGLIVGWLTARATGQPLNLSRLEVPAGPGFALGIISTALYLFHDLFMRGF